MGYLSGRRQRIVLGVRPHIMSRDPSNYENKKPRNNEIVAIGHLIIDSFVA